MQTEPFMWSGQPSRLALLSVGWAGLLHRERSRRYITGKICCCGSCRHEVARRWMQSTIRYRLFGRIDDNSPNQLWHALDFVLRR